MYAFAIWTSVEEQDVIVNIEVEENGEWSVLTRVSKQSQESPNKSLERTHGK